MEKSKWDKPKLELIVKTIGEHTARVSNLLERLSEPVSRAPEVRDELKTLKELFCKEHKRIEIESHGSITETSAFYHPAIRDAAVNFPALNRPNSWFDGLCVVHSDLNYWLSEAKSVLAKLEIK